MIAFKNVSFTLSHKVCFEGFSYHIHEGQKIAIIGVNGSGKTSLLKIMKGDIEPTQGQVYKNPALKIGYVGQDTPEIEPYFKRFEELSIQLGKNELIDHEYENLLKTLNFNYENDRKTVLDRWHIKNTKSGGEKILNSIAHVMAINSDIILLDEPTNHLDIENRKKIFSMLLDCKKTVIIASHDMELLKYWPNTIWDIQDERITVFEGNYEDYLNEKEFLNNKVAEKIETIKKEKKKTKIALQKEMKRAANLKKQGSRNTLPKIVLNSWINTAEKQTGKNQSHLREKQQELSLELKSYRLSEKIIPRFYIKPTSKNKLVIEDGRVGYLDTFVLTNINLAINYGERIAILGSNASGKTTLFKGIINDPHISRSGQWCVPAYDKIGYLDQHYNVLDLELTPIEMIEAIKKNFDVRKFLNDFLFKKEATIKAKYLSGGEKMRLCLAQIAISNPSLLLMDEITNNIDLTTRGHVIDVLNTYEGSMIVISHDIDFLKLLSINRIYQIENQILKEIYK